MSWTDPPVFYPHELLTALVTTVRDHQETYLAIAERRLGLPARRLIAFRQVDEMVGPGADLARDPLPLCQIALPGTDGDILRDKNGVLSAQWTVGVQILVAGQDLHDTLTARSVYSTVVTEILLQQLPTAGRSWDGLRLDRVDNDSARVTDGGQSNLIGQTELTFTVNVPILAVDRSPWNPVWTPGSPGGPPAGPYTEPVPLPATTTVDHPVDRT